jgi:hypothetical protein
VRKWVRRLGGDWEEHLIWNDFYNRDAWVILVTLVDAISKVGEASRDTTSDRDEREEEREGMERVLVMLRTMGSRASR